MRFENEQDLKNEQSVINIFSNKFNAFAEKLGENDIDYALYRGDDLVAYAEVKCYNVPSDKYDTQVLSMIKIVKMQEKNRYKPTFFVLRYSDGIIYYIKVDEIEGVAKYGGRKIRKGSTNDQEMLVYCKKNLMTKL